MSDILDRIDLAIVLQEEAVRCCPCGNLILANGPSLDFCGAGCQRNWYMPMTVERLDGGALPDDRLSERPERYPLNPEPIWNFTRADRLAGLGNRSRYVTLNGSVGVNVSILQDLIARSDAYYRRFAEAADEICR